MTIETLITWINVVVITIAVLYLFVNLAINKPKGKIKIAVNLLVLFVIVTVSTIFTYNIATGTFQSSVFSGIFSAIILAVIFIDRKNFLRNIEEATLTARKTMREENNQ